MRLIPVADVLMQHIRGQATDLARVQSQVVDLSGLLRRHVSIACPQVLLPDFTKSDLAIQIKTFKL